MKKLSILALSILSLNSCKKDPVNNTNKIITTELSDNVYDSLYVSKPTNGELYVFGQGSYSLNAQGFANKYNSLQIHGSFYDQANNIIPGGNVTIDTFHFTGALSYGTQIDNTVGNSFFGRNIQVMLTPPAGQAPQFSAQVYLPLNLFAQIGSSDLNIFHPTGDTLFWNADPANKNGMIISLDYDPNQYLNNNLSSPNYITKTIAGIADNGSYVIPANILSMFPPGGFINVKVTRDANTLVSYNQYSYIYTVVFNLKVP
ncbi:MAG: hypothetical protein ABI359_11950 [Ginsengibacter sp.]